MSYTNLIIITVVAVFVVVTMIMTMRMTSTTITSMSLKHIGWNLLWFKIWCKTLFFGFHYTDTRV